MKKVMVVLAALGLTGSLWAADPIIGTWKLNIEKSKFSPILGEAPKEGMEVYREISDEQIELTRSPSGTVITWPRQGGIATSTRQDQDSEELLLVETLVAPGEWYVTYIGNGKQTVLMHKAVSKDGKTLIQTIKGADTQGRTFEQIRVYERQ